MLLAWYVIVYKLCTKLQLGHNSTPTELLISWGGGLLHARKAHHVADFQHIHEHPHSPSIPPKDLGNWGPCRGYAPQEGSQFAALSFKLSLPPSGAWKGRAQEGLPYCVSPPGSLILLVFCAVNHMTRTFAHQPGANISLLPFLALLHN